MNHKKRGGNKKKNNKKKSKTLEPVILTTKEATLIYELMHDVKVTYLGMKKEEQARASAKDMIAVCNGIMNKVENLVLGESIGEGKTQFKKKS